MDNSGLGKRFIDEVHSLECDLQHDHPGMLDRGDLFTVGKVHATATYHEVKRHRDSIEKAMLSNNGVAFATALDKWRNSIKSMVATTAKQLELAA